MQEIRYGPTLRVTRNVTMGDLYNVLGQLTSLGNVCLSYASEGGITLQDHTTKEFRFFRLEEWDPTSTDMERIVATRGRRLGTRFKALDGSPAWTQQEWDTIASALATVGLVSEP